MESRELLEERAMSGVAVLYCEGLHDLVRVVRHDPVDGIRLIECPGGGRETGESSLETALRELGEELIGNDRELVAAVAGYHIGTEYVEDGGRTLVGGKTLPPAVHALHFFRVPRRIYDMVVSGFVPNNEADEIRTGTHDITDTFRMSRLARRYFVPAIETFIRTH